MGQSHAAIDAALPPRSEDKVQADQIERIDIDVPEAAYGYGGWKAVRPPQPIGALMNVAYAVAAALADGDSAATDAVQWAGFVKQKQLCWLRGV
jgi:2-methylcitrate dehydratase PrpD